MSTDTQYLLEQDGRMYIHIATHGRPALWVRMSEAQKVTCTYMEKLGWQLVSVDINGHRQAHLHQDGMTGLTIARK